MLVLVVVSCVAFVITMRDACVCGIGPAISSSRRVLWLAVPSVIGIVTAMNVTLGEKPLRVSHLTHEILTFILMVGCMGFFARAVYNILTDFGGDADFVNDPLHNLAFSRVFWCFVAGIMVFFLTVPVA